VTNEGGITCHAAIVSRELSKPCVIGTRIATQVLKDGDLVEVDADKGEVRVLEKNEHFNFREDEYEYVWGGTGFSMLFMDLFFSAIGRFPFFEQFCVSENNEMQVYVSKKTFLECSRYVHTNLSSSEQIHNFCINAHACADAFGSLDVSLPLPLLWEKFVSLSNNFLFEYSKLDPYFSDEIVITKDGKENIVYLGQQKNELREKLNAIYFAEDSIFSRILNRISGECCIDRETLYCSSSEDVLKKSENPHLEMKGSTGFVLHMSDGKVRYTKDSRHVVLVKEIFSKDHIQQGCGRVFPGTSVSKRGIYKGKVKKITLNYLSLQKTIDEINQVRGGYVLVTDHTTPELLPAMKKAIAIVADMGGLLSHAAITSRELDLPCIVGTKCAAQVLHDGDLVEVDADKGELRVVERKKAFDPQESTFEAQQRGTKHASSETYDRLAQLGLWDKEKWYEQGRWIQSPFVYTFFSHWYKKNIVKRVVPELSFHTTFSIDGYAFVSNEDAEHLSAYIKKGYQDKTLGLLVQRIDKEGKAISRKVLDMLEKDNKYLREHMDEFINLYKEFAAFWCVEAYIGDHIIRASKELGYITSESELFGKVHPYLRKTWIEGEAEEIKRIAINVMDGHREDVQTRLRIYLEKYSWIKIAKWLGEPMTMEQAQERLQEEIVNYQQGNYIHPDIVQEEPDDIVRLSVATAY
jgi:phosphohistidine swiveling domain-containing protein